MPSTITLSLNGIPQIGSFIELKLGGLNDLKETFQVQRFSPFQSSLGVDSNATLLAYSMSFIADYNLGGLFRVNFIEGVSNAMTIEHPNSGYFSNEMINDNTGEFFWFINNTPDREEIRISHTANESVSDKCSLVRLEITTNILATSYKIDNGSVVQNSQNPFEFNYFRGQIARVEVFSSSGASSYKNIKTPDILVGSNISTSYVNSPTGATLTVDVSQTYELQLTYSLDNIIFNSSNILFNLSAGNYTIYVRDQFGCTASKTFTIEDFNTSGTVDRIPYSDLPSKSNSIRFAKYLEHFNCNNYKNDENTLSTDLPYTQNNQSYNQLFQNCDVITTQVKTNYKNVVATVIDCQGNEFNIPVEKKSDNTDLKDKRTAFIYNLNNEGLQSGIYFTSGDIYEYGTFNITGSYSLNGNLPAWGVIGNFVFILGGWYQITNIVYDSSKSAYVLVIDLPYTEEETSLVVSSIYNLEQYDIYEFTISMINFYDRKIQVNITQTDDNESFIPVIYLSEIIDVRELQKDTLLIEYYNEENTDIFYATGIKNKIRVPIEFFSGGYSDETTSESTDTETYLINSENYETDLIAFKLTPKEIMRKIVQALSHKFVFLNEVQYVKSDSPEVNHLIGSNLYRINAQMTKANAVYTSNGIGQVFNIGSTDSPALIDKNSNGYLKVKN